VENVQVTELRGNLRQVIEKVAKGRRPVIILRHDKPLAMLVPPPRSGHVKPDIPLAALDEFVSRFDLSGLYLFGSILTDRFHEGSDIDVMIDTGTRMPSYFETCRMSDELETLFGRPVDLLIKSTVERDKNAARRNVILGSAKLIVERKPS
jgi:uncharacterized protein